MAFVFESIQMEILVGCISLIFLLYVYFTWSYDYWKKKGIPYVKPVPFFGNMMGVTLGRIFEGLLFKEIYDEHKGHRFVGIYQFRRPTLMLRDPDIIKDVMVKNFASFHDRGIPVDEEKHPLSAHLFNLPGPRWRALRAKLTPTFTTGKMKMMYQLMEECSEELRSVLKEPARRGEELEMREVMAKFTTDVIGSCAFGLQMNSMKDSESEFRYMGRKVFAVSFLNSIRRMMIVFLNPIANLLNLSLFGSEVEKFFLNAVKETVEFREKNNVKRNDFIQLLMKLRDKENIDPEQEVSNGKHEATDEADINMTDNLLAAQAFVFFLAGFETSSTLLSFTLYELALNPDIQTKLRNEVDSVLQKYEGKLTYEVIQEMEYLDKVISESLRKYPPGAALIRVCTKPYTIPNTNIELEKGIRLIVPVLALQLDPKYYPNPDKFDPERFSVEEKANRRNFTYLPFGEGPRNCIGMRFGLLQAKLGLASLIRDFQFSPSKRTVVPIRIAAHSLVTASKDGIHLKISHRK